MTTAAITSYDFACYRLSTWVVLTHVKTLLMATQSGLEVEGRRRPQALCLPAEAETAIWLIPGSWSFCGILVLRYSDIYPEHFWHKIAKAPGRIKQTPVAFSIVFVLLCFLSLNCLPFFSSLFCFLPSSSPSISSLLLCPLFSFLFFSPPFSLHLAPSLLYQFPVFPHFRRLLSFHHSLLFPPCCPLFLSLLSTFFCFSTHSSFFTLSLSYKQNQLKGERENYLRMFGLPKAERSKSHFITYSKSRAHISH